MIFDEQINNDGRWQREKKLKENHVFDAPIATGGSIEVQSIEEESTAEK